MVRKPFSLPVALLLFAALLFVRCDGDLSGNYAMSINLVLDCEGERQNVSDGFAVRIAQNNGNITVTPNPPTVSKRLNGTGTISQTEIEFTGVARTSPGSSIDFNFQGNYKGTRSGTSYRGSVDIIRGTYAGCRIVSAEFILTKQ